MKRIMAIFWVVILMFTGVVYASSSKGSWSNGVSYTYNDGILVISCEGEEADLSFEVYNWPWERMALKVKEINIGEGITEIGEEVFKNLTTLKTVRLPSTITTIDESAFYNCPYIENIEMPESFNESARNIFKGTLWYENKYENGGDGFIMSGNVLFGYVSDEKIVRVPDGIEIIEDSAFKDKGIEEIILPSSLKEIRAYAFSGNNMKEVVIPDSVEKIGGYAFRGCKELSKVKLSANLSEMGREAFSMTGIESISLPDSLKAIPRSGFSYCQNLKSIELSKNLETIGEYAFDRCGMLEDVTFPDTLKIISNGAFVGCPIKDIEFPENLETIGYAAFEECMQLGSVRLPSGLKLLKQSAFRNSGVTEVYFSKLTIPDAVIETAIFRECKNLTRVVYQDGVTHIPGLFYNCDALTEVVMPEGVTHIGASAFTECGGLRDITIAQSVTHIGAGAFSGCETLTVHIPPGVSEISDIAFSATKAIIYARPGSAAYEFALEKGYEVHSEYMQVGDVVDEIIYSDIYVTLNGRLIPSYCVDGRTLILLRDLERYGFDVWFDSENKIAYAEFKPDKEVYDGEATVLADKNVLYTDIRAIVNGVEVEVRNTNGYIAVEAERLGEYVPNISCVYQNEWRRLQMKAF